MLDVLAATVKEQVQTAGAKTGAATDVKSGAGVAIYTVMGLVGLVAVVMVIIGGVSIAVAQGDPAKVKKGRTTITFGLVGMAICILAFVITSVVLTALTKA
jgi:hypothetical protein